MLTATLQHLMSFANNPVKYGTCITPLHAHFHLSQTMLKAHQAVPRDECFCIFASVIAGEEKNAIPSYCVIFFPRAQLRVGMQAIFLSRNF